MEKLEKKQVTLIILLIKIDASKKNQQIYPPLQNFF
jgi:hypothetical protein